ncbi:MAG: group 1 truncated hemoglobin [Desulfobacterales bacterium]|nr:group 1 truncated hemoglobin [Desulfobacterales bacterium]
MPNNYSTLFERIGGEQMIAEVVDDFYERVLADPELKPFFKNTSMDKLRCMQKEFFSVALDGPITYTGKPLAHVHHGRGITKYHFTLFVNHLLNTLRYYQISDQEVADIISRINTYADEITGDISPAG